MLNYNANSDRQKQLSISFNIEMYNTKYVQNVFQTNFFFIQLTQYNYNNQQFHGIGKLQHPNRKKTVLIRWFDNANSEF